MTRVLVTGANGFIGQVLCRLLLENGFDVVAGVRDKRVDWQADERINVVEVGDINRATDWCQALQGVSVVVHLAARVHVMDEQHKANDAVYHEVNVLGTENLAKQALSAGVLRFIYLSSIKVNGAVSVGKPLMADDVVVAPDDAYALSKWQAEQVLRQVGSETGLQVVVIRPPLVYGVGVKGNFWRLMKWVEKGFPLPLAKVNNRRSLVNVDNLCDLIRVCIQHPQASGEVFLVADGQDLSTPELITLIAHHLSKKPVLFAVPLKLVVIFARLFGKQAQVARLSDSLQVCIAKNQQYLGWIPPYTVDEGIARAVMSAQNKGG